MNNEITQHLAIGRCSTKSLGFCAAHLSQKQLQKVFGLSSSSSQNKLIGSHLEIAIASCLVLRSIAVKRYTNTSFRRFPITTMRFQKMLDNRSPRRSIFNPKKRGCQISPNGPHLLVLIALPRLENCISIDRSKRICRNRILSSRQTHCSNAR